MQHQRNGLKLLYTEGYKKIPLSDFTKKFPVDAVPLIWKLKDVLIDRNFELFNVDSGVELGDIIVLQNNRCTIDSV